MVEFLQYQVGLTQCNNYYHWIFHGFIYIYTYTDTYIHIHIHIHIQIYKYTNIQIYIYIYIYIYTHRNMVITIDNLGTVDDIGPHVYRYVACSGVDGDTADVAWSSIRNPRVPPESLCQNC